MIRQELVPRIIDCLTDLGEATAHDVARAIRARTIDVLDTLRDCGAFAGPFRGRDGRLYYRLAPKRPAASAGTGTRSRGRRTHCEKVLDLLSDGEWHTSRELLDLGVMGHSRVADLRAQGHRIVCERIPGAEGAAAYRYRLLPPVRGQRTAEHDREEGVDIFGAPLDGDGLEEPTPILGGAPGGCVPVGSSSPPQGSPAASVAAGCVEQGQRESEPAAGSQLSLANEKGR